MPLPFPYSRQQNPLVLPAGYLRTEIQILSAANLQDGAGGVVLDWSQATKILPAMAAVEMIAETEIYQTGQFADNVTHRVVLRYPGSVGDQAGHAGCGAKQWTDVRCAKHGELAERQPGALDLLS